MTQGGPENATTTVMYQTVTTAFNQDNIGRASAMTVVFFAHRRGHHAHPARGSSERSVRSHEHVRRHAAGPPSGGEERRRGRAAGPRARLRKALSYAFMVLLTLFFFAPILFMFIGTLKPTDKVLNGLGGFTPNRLSLRQLHGRLRPVQHATRPATSGSST